LDGSIGTPSHSAPETDGLAVSSKETSAPAASSGPSTTVPSARTTRSPDSPAFGPALTVHLTVNSASSGTRPAASPSISLWMENVAGSAADRHSSLPERSEEHTSELQSRFDLVCRLLLEKKNNNSNRDTTI